MADTVRELDRLEERVNEQIARANRQTTISVVAGIVVLVILAVYFSILTPQVKKALDPKGIAEMGSQMIVQRIQNPENREMIVAQLKTVGPAFVDDFVSTAINKQLPELRTTTETRIKEEVTKQFDAYDGQVKKAIDTALDGHEENIRLMVTHLQTEEGKREFEESLFSTLDEAIMGQEVQVELQSYGTALAEIDLMLTGLAEAEAAETPEQQHLVRLLGILRELANRSELGEVDLTDKK